MLTRVAANKLSKKTSDLGLKTFSKGLRTFGTITENKPLYPDTREEFKYLRENYLKTSKNSNSGLKQSRKLRSQGAKIVGSMAKRRKLMKQEIEVSNFIELPNLIFPKIVMQKKAIFHLRSTKKLNSNPLNSKVPSPMSITSNKYSKKSMTKS